MSTFFFKRAYRILKKNAYMPLLMSKIICSTQKFYTSYLPLLYTCIKQTWALYTFVGRYFLSHLNACQYITSVHESIPTIS